MGSSDCRGFLTTKELCKRYGLSRCTVQKYIKRGFLPPAVCFGRTRRWPIEAIEKFESEESRA